MSLAVLANHMASKGRGPDSMLIHMSPHEVQGLQALAQSHGGSLTINPHTGLPEAGFLDKMLPAIIGFGITAMTGIPAWQAGLGVGAFETARTGDLAKGVAAGLGAYGGGSLGTNLTAAAVADTAGSQIASQAAEQAALEGVQLPSNYAELAAKTATPEQLAAARDSMSFGDLASKSASNAAASPLATLKANASPLAMAVGPAILAEMSAKNNMPKTVTQPGKVTPYSYDPYSGEYTAASPYEVTRKAADGGLMGMANNSGSGGMFDFTKDGSNEPVVRNMASGGIAHFADGGDAALAAYQAGDYGKAAEILGSSGMSAQDVVSKYGLSAADAATVAQNLGYAGDMSGLHYGAPTPAASAAAPATTTTTDNWQPNLTQITPDANAPATTAAATTDNWKPNLTQITPGYNSFTNDQYAAFFADPKNVAALNTPGGLQALEAQYKADPAEAMKYLQGASNLGLSAADMYQLGQGKGLAGVNTAINDWIAKYPNATGAQISDAMKSAGMTQADINRYFNEKNSAYGTNLATGQAFTGAGDIYNIGQGKGFADITNNIKNWIATYPNATLADAQAAMSAAGLNEMDVIRATGKTSAELYKQAKIEKTTGTGTTTGTTTVTGADTGTTTGAGTQGGISLGAATNLPPGVSGAGITTVNPNGTITTRPNIPGIPEGGFTGAQSVRNAWTQGGGSLGYTPYVPKTIEDFNAKYNTLTGGSKQNYDFLTGKGNYPTKPFTPTGEVMKPYAESVLGMPANISKKRYLYDSATQQYKINPDYAIPTYDANGKKTYNVTNRDVATYLAGKPSSSDFYNWAKTNNLTIEQIAAATGMPITEVQKLFSAGATADTTAATAKAAADAAAASTSTDSGGGGGGEANGGLMAMAGGGMAAGGQFGLGDYSDGGRLLRGPGDGVSDSIPATIGNKRPARLADGEFVVPARIVSELGNGSTEAGARKLYAMMDRVQAARKGSIGKGNVAKNSRADKYLPV